MTVKVAEAMADIIDYIHIYQPYKEQYMHSETDSGRKVYDLLSRLYADINDFCERAVKYYQQSTASIAPTFMKNSREKLYSHFEKNK